MRPFPLPPEFIHCTGILESPCAALAFHARLPNGKKTIAFVEQRDAALMASLRPGALVCLTICPADFERARITGLAAAQNAREEGSGPA